MKYLKYKGYRGTVEYDSDGSLYGKVTSVGNALIMYEGSTIDELQADFIQGVESYIAGCEAEGILPKKTRSSRLSVCVTPEQYSRIAMQAKRSGMSISQFIKHALALV